MRFAIFLLLLGTPSLFGQTPAASKELKEYRILSVSESAKMVLISDFTTKTRYLLDASNAKVILDGEEIELTRLQDFSAARVAFRADRKSVDGVRLDGIASRFEITIRK